MKIIILNTGCANLASIQWAIHRLGYVSEISLNKKKILNADKILLPGVGTAKSAMGQLNKYNLIEIIKKFQQPILGICLGMQLLGIKSDENNGIATLGLINYSTNMIKKTYEPIPHMGWNRIYFTNQNKLFSGIKNGSYVYFVHSYIVSVNTFTIAKCYYSEYFSAAIQKDNFFGVQFHPERSGTIGAKVLKNFLEI